MMYQLNRMYNLDLDLFQKFWSGNFIKKKFHRKLFVFKLFEYICGPISTYLDEFRVEFFEVIFKIVLRHNVWNLNGTWHHNGTIYLLVYWSVMFCSYVVLVVHHHFMLCAIKVLHHIWCITLLNGLTFTNFISQHVLPITMPYLLCLH